MKTNTAGITIIRSFETLRLKAYQDSGGVWTIGWGHTGGVQFGDMITPALAETLFQSDVQRAERQVNSHQGTWNENQFSALVSFTFNCGVGNLVKLISRPNIEKRILLYCHDKRGEVDGGLKLRRQAELGLFSTTFS